MAYQVCDGATYQVCDGATVNDVSLQRRKTAFSHLISSKKKGISFEHTICHLSSDITGLWPMSLEDCQREY
jgi:hypothetical protein